MAKINGFCAFFTFFFLDESSWKTRLIILKSKQRFYRFFIKKLIVTTISKANYNSFYIYKMFYLLHLSKLNIEGKVILCWRWSVRVGEHRL